MKLKSLVLVAAVLATVIGLGAGRASAVPNPPHHQVIQVVQGSCVVNFKHGNGFGGAYAAYDKTSLANSCGPMTSVRVVALHSFLGIVMGDWCGEALIPPQPNCMQTTGGWQQSFRSSSFIVTSKLNLCANANPNSCVMREYSGN